MIRKFIFASLNIDEAILRDSDSNKEQNLIYGLFSSVALSTSVVFGITLYACSVVPDLNGLYAWLIATIVAAIIFRFDCAIIGSEWDRSQNHQSEILQTYAIPAIFWGFINFVFKVVRLSPRIAFSIAIALFIATIAELAIQKEAIEEVLIENAREHNKESTKKRDAKIEEHKKSIKKLTDEQDAIKVSIDEQDVRNFDEKLENFENKANSLRTSEAEIEKNLEILKTKKEQAEILNRKINNLQILMDKEENDADRCLVLGSPDCRGPVWREHRDNQRKAEAELDEIGNVAGLDARIKVQEDELIQVTAQLADIDTNLAKVGRLNFSELEEALANKNEEIENKKQENADDLREFDDGEKASGDFRDPYKNYDFLLLYSGLEKLHADPDRGPGARQFSRGLLIFIVLMELSAVISALFFLPYSIYASKAYVDVKERQLEEEIAMSKFKHRRETELFMSDDLERTLNKVKAKTAKRDRTETPPTS